MQGDEAYILSKALTSAVSAGVSNYTISDSGLLEFDTSDGQHLTYQFREPEDGVSITGVSVDQNKHLIIAFSNGTTQDAGIVPTTKGDKGDKGDDGIGVPEGGTAGQVLAKQSGTDYDFVWADEDYSLTSNVVTNTAVGAIPSGTTLAQGTTFTEFVQKLLVSELEPTVSFSVSNSGNREWGTLYTETFTFKVTDMGTSTKVKSVAYYANDVLIHTDPINTTTTGTWDHISSPVDSTTVFKAIATYTKSDGSDDTITKTQSINFYYNKFYGGVDSLTPSEATVEALTKVLASTRSLTANFTVSGGRICYAYPKSLGALTSIKDGNGFSLMDSFTRAEVTYTHNPNGASVEYYRYVLTDATTVSDYRVIFS